MLSNVTYLICLHKKLKGKITERESFFNFSISIKIYKVKTLIILIKTVNYIIRRYY